MTPQQQGAPLNAWDSELKRLGAGLGIPQFIYKTIVVTELEVRKLRHDPSQLFTRAVQPVLWLLIFGQVFTRVHGIPTGNLSYLDFMTPGILAQSVLFMAIFNGLSVIWERDLGILHKLMVSPTPRAALVLGKSIAAAVRSISQVVIIYGVATVLKVHIDWNILPLLGVAIAVLLGATLFSNFSLAIACLVKTHERFMGIGQLLMMPLFFASNAIYPIDIMPTWLQFIAHINPLTYLVDALRRLMVIGGTSVYPLELDFGVLLGITVILTIISGKLYPRLVT